jgi:hypothetical protein
MLFILFRKKNICHICVSNYPWPSTYFFNRKKRHIDIRSRFAYGYGETLISGKTLKTAVINTNTHIYKMKRKKKDRKK